MLASEDEVRTSALDEPLRLMDGLIAQGYPVIFTGDHNEPSSLDWTEATVAARTDVPEAVPWPVSEAILGLGFHDTYREVHPDPVEDPGITHEIAGDRIDYVYAAGPVDDARQPARRGGGRAGRRDRVHSRGRRTTARSCRRSTSRPSRCRSWSR